MEDYVARKALAAVDARAALQQAQADVLVAEQEHSESMQALSSLKDRMDAEEAVEACTEATKITGSQMASLISLAGQLPKDQAAMVQTALRNMKPLLEAAGQTPGPSPITPQTTGPRSPSPVATDRGREITRSRSVPRRLRAKSADPRALPRMYPSPVSSTKDSSQVFQLGINSKHD